MLLKKCKHVLLLLMVAVTLWFTLPVQALAYTLPSGAEITASGATSTVSNQTDYKRVRASSRSSSDRSFTVTVKNNGAEGSVMTFTYEAVLEAPWTIDQTATSGSIKLAYGESKTFTLTAPKGYNGKYGELRLSAFEFATPQAMDNIVIYYDSQIGTVTKDGEEVVSGTGYSFSIEGATLVAEPANSDVKFLGWVDGNGKVVSNDATYKLEPTDKTSTILKAAFASSSSAAWFKVGTLYFDNLNDANAAASSGANKTIIPVADGTVLPVDGGYTISSGVTLLIPFDDAGTLYTASSGGMSQTNPDYVDTFTKPTPYRKLILADGVKLTINGAMSVSGKHCYAKGSATVKCTPSGPLGMVEMKGNSSIIVNGTLYAWGYIYSTDSQVKSSVSITETGTVYELFQLLDFRGGTKTAALTDVENGAYGDKQIFPFSQYYVQNVEVPMHYEYGATEYAYVTLYASSIAVSKAVSFLGTSGCMFTLGDGGTATKYYDGAEDRIILELNGNASLDTIVIDPNEFIPSFIAGAIDLFVVDSDQLVMGLGSNYTVKVKSGSTVTVNQDLAMLPGSKLEIEAGANVVLGSGTRIYIYDQDQWGNYVYGGKLVTIKYSPTCKKTRTAADLVDASILVNGTIDATNGSIYTTTGGANIWSEGTGVIKTTAGTETVTYQYDQGADKLHEIPITAAQLHHGPDFITRYGEAYAYMTSQTGTYMYVDAEDKWVCAVDDGNGNLSVNHGANIKPVAEVKQTCEADGHIAYYQCSVCHSAFKDEAGTQVITNLITWLDTPTENGGGKLVKLGHDWNDAGYEWSADHSSCTATRTCKNNTMLECTETETVTSTSAVTTQPTCEDMGKTTYTATFSASWAAKQEVTLTNVDPVQHDWKATEYVWTQVDGAWTCTAKRTCKNQTVPAECNLTATATVTSAEAKAATCETPGDTTYTATFDAGVAWATKQTKTVIGDIAKLNHNWQATEYVWTQVDGEWTCTATRTCTKQTVAAECNLTDTASAVYETSKEPTCVAMGDTTYTATFTQDWAKVQIQTLTDIPKVPHSGETYYVDLGTQHEKRHACCDTLIETKTHEYVDGVCECASTSYVTLAAMDVSCEAEVIIRYKLLIPKYILDNDNITVIMTKDGRWGPEVDEYTMAQLREAGPDESGRYVVSSGVASGEMRRNVTIEIKNGSESVEIMRKKTGEKATTFAFCVCDYAEAVLALDSASKEWKDAVTALVTYGGYAQEYFYVDVTNPSYKILDAVPSLENEGLNSLDAIAITGEIEGLALNAYSCEMDSNLSIGLKFKLEDGYTIDQYTFKLTDEKGEVITLTATLEQKTGRYVVIIPEIAPYYMDHVYKVTVSNEAGQKYSIDVSMLSYVKDALERGSPRLINMAKAMYLYNKAVQAHFDNMK